MWVTIPDFDMFMFDYLFFIGISMYSFSSLFISLFIVVSPPKERLISIINLESAFDISNYFECL